MKQELIQQLEVYFGFSDVGEETLENFSEETMEVKESVLLMKDFLNALNIYGNNSLKEKMEVFEEEYQLNKSGENAPLDVSANYIPEAIVEELFESNEKYETLIQGNMRGNELNIEAPENGFEWKGSAMNFQLSKSVLNKKVNYTIENNKAQEIISNIKILESQMLSINLDIENQLPGKYYLKLFSNDNFTIISFYIHKEIL